MDVQAATGLIEQVNEQLDPVALLERIGFAVDKIQVVGASVKGFCPVHKDTRFRSLLIDAKKKTFKCTIKTCRGFHGGTLVELYALVQEISPIAAASELARLFNLDVDTSHLDQVANAFLDEAERAFVDHDHERAEAAARQALQFRSDLMEARLLLANILAAKGESAQACDEFIAVAENYLSKGNYEDADRVLERASLDFPDNEDLLLLKVHSAELQGQLDKAEQLLLDLAARREAGGRTVENVGLYEKLATLFPEKLSYIEKLAEIHLARREFDKAITTLNNLAFRYMKEERHDDVVRVVERAAAIRRPEAGVMSVYVDALVALGDYEKARSAVHDLVLNFIENTMFFEAQQAARRWAEIEPESPEVHEWLGLIWQEQANGPEAAKEFREAAHLARKRGDLERAIEFLGQARFNEPENIELRWDLIALLRETAQLDQAFEELCSLADFLFAMNNPEEGERAILQALEIRPLTATRLELAPVLAKQGCVDTAAKLYLEAAHECEEIDDVAGAVACYQSYLELKPQDHDAKLRYAELLWESDLIRLATQVTLELLREAEGDIRREVGLRLLPRIADHPPEDHSTLRDFAEIALSCDIPEAARSLAMHASRLASDQDAPTMADLFGRLTQLCPDDVELLQECAVWHRKAGNDQIFLDIQTQIVNLAERRGDVRTALAHLSLALEAQPDQPMLVKRRADLLERLDDPELARAAHRDYLVLAEKHGNLQELAEEYRRYLEKWPQERDIRQKLADVLQQLGQLEDAQHELAILLAAARLAGDLDAQRELLEKMSKLAPDKPQLQLEFADVLYAVGDSEQALKIFVSVAEQALSSSAITLAQKAMEGARRIAPTNKEVLLIALRVLRSQNDFERAEEVAQQLATNGDSSHLIELYNEQLGKALERQQLDVAKRIAGKWLSFQPDEPETLARAAEVELLLGDTRAASELLKKEANILLQRGQTDRGAEVLLRAETLAPDDFELKQQLFDILLQQGRHDQAAELAGRILNSLKPAGDAEALLLWLKRLRDLRPQDTSLLKELAETTYKAKGASDALPLFSELLRLYSDMGQTAEQAALYVQLIQLYPAENKFREEYAEALEKAGNLHEAKKQWIELARIYRDELNDPVRAIPSLGRATSLVPEADDAVLFEEMAGLYLASKQTDFAAGALRETARLYEEQRRHSDALRVMQQLCSLAAAMPSDYAKLGDLFQQAGSIRDALNAYKAAYELAEQSSVSPRELRTNICEKIVALDPEDTEYLVTLIEMLQPDEAAKRAILWLTEHGHKVGFGQRTRVLEAAKRVAPKNLEVRQTLCTLWRESGDTLKLADELIALCEVASGKGANKVRKEAIEELRQLPRSPELTLKLASFMADSGDTEHAVGCYTAVADELIEAGQWQTALQALEAAMALDPAALAAPLVAKLYRASGADPSVKTLADRSFDAALMARSRTRALVLGAVLLEYAELPSALALLERINQKAGAAFVVTIGQTHLDWLLEHGRAREAEAFLNKILELAGSSPDAWYLAAQIYRKLGQGEQAAQASLQAARLFAQAGAVTEEESCYREVLEVFPDDIPTLETLVGFYERERRKPDVIDLVKRLVELTLAKDDHAAAAKWISKYLQYDPGNLDYREKLVEQLVKAGKGEEAVEALFELARMLRSLRFIDRVYAVYERVRALDPENEEALSGLLELAEEEKNTERALRYALELTDLKKRAESLRAAADFLKSFAERHSDQISAWEKLHVLAKELGDGRLQALALRSIGYHSAKVSDFDRAIAAFEQLLVIQPNDRETLRVLLDCCSNAKRIAKAADVATKLFELELQGGNPARVREAALTVLAFDEKRAPVRQQLATVLAELGQFEEAVRQWRLASEVFIAEKNYVGALQCVESITRVDPKDVQGWERYAQLLALTGDEDAAQDALVNLANALVERGEIERACRVLERVVERPELHPAVREKALEVYRRCGVRDEILPEIVWLAHYYLSRRNLPKAEELIREGLEIDPDDITLLECRVELARRLGKREEVLFRLRDLAQRYLELGDKQKAAHMLSELVAEDPSLVDIRLQLAKVYEDLEQFQRAHEEYLEVVRYKLEHGEVEEAREVAETALAGAGKSTEFRARLADLFASYRAVELASRYLMQCARESEEHGNVERAIQFLQRAAEIRPKWIDPYERLAELCSKVNRPLEALSALERLSELLLDQKRLREAVDVLKRRIRLAPKEAEPRRALIDLLEVLGEREARLQQLQEYADLLITRGEVEEAVEVYRQLTQLQPDEPVVLHRYLELFAQVGNELEVLGDYQRLADLYIKKGQFQEATRTFERILSIDRRQRDVREKFIQFLQSAGQRSRAIAEMIKLADVCMAMGDYSNAIRWLANANALNPSDLNVLESLAEAYARAGNADAAAEHFYKLVRQCAETDPWRAVAACRRILDLVPGHRPTREIFSELLMKVGERAEAAANALALAELLRNSGEHELAKEQERLARQYEPETIESLTEKLKRSKDADPSQRYEWLVRLGDLAYQAGDIDLAIESYRKAREIENSNPELIRKYVNALLQIAPEHEAIADLIELARSYEGRGAALRALETYEQVLKIDAKNPIAKAGRSRMRKITNTE
ncbi:MAG: tetratricopeptide repeat protein [Candidatus Sumerlaeaceae bacterium]|nr:tetratricopeptide repeat protein [Candidatus Sumerlaeaceae bacterium]